MTRHDTPPLGVPIVTADDDVTPPPQELYDLCETPEQRAELERKWATTPYASARRREPTDQFEHRIRILETAAVDVRGIDGKNGKLGALKERVDKADARRWTVIMWAAGLLVTVVTTAILMGRWIGRIETDVGALKARAERRDKFQQPDAPVRSTQP
jgi:hypothetical protein